MALPVVLHSDAVAKGRNQECTKLGKRRDGDRNTGLRAGRRSYLAALARFLRSLGFASGSVLFSDISWHWRHSVVIGT